MQSTDQSGPEYDAVIIGAGVSGLHQLYRLTRLGLKARVFETAGDVGGTWYWNRYPGARFDSESYTYGYSFSEDVLQEWNWSERYAAQPETERYLHYVTDKFDLRQHIEFNARVAAATFDQGSGTWTLEIDGRAPVRARFLITAIGVLSAPQMPSNRKGLESFEGKWYHTGMWPHEPVELEGKRVAVLGTGASGIQVITEVAKCARQLTVFQRRANYAAPLRNTRLTPEQQDDVRARYPEIFSRCNANAGGFEFTFDTAKGVDVPPEDRLARYEELWRLPGFAKWMAGYADVVLDAELNHEYSDFVRGKIRERISDPAIADRLTPTFPFGTRRVPLESGYFEVYNQENVELVSLGDTPIECYTPNGIRAGGIDREFDVIIFATGFDAFTGAFNKIGIRGVGGELLADKWADGPQTNLGLLAAGFPNLFLLLGPHSKVFCNVPRCSEQNVEWVSDCIEYMVQHGYTRIETSLEAEKAWTEHVFDVFAPTLLAKTQTDSFWLGSNTPGKKKTIYGYMGPFPKYRIKCDQVAANGYEGFVFS